MFHHLICTKIWWYYSEVMNNPAAGSTVAPETRTSGDCATAWSAEPMTRRVAADPETPGGRNHTAPERPLGTLISPFTQPNNFRDKGIVNTPAQTMVRQIQLR
jgi:hypothetical protein